MTFSQAVSTGLQKFYTPYGRASLSEFWWYYLAMFILTAVLGVIGGFLEAVGIEQTWIGIILQCLSCVLGISIICAEIRRLHDTGKSGWNVCWGFIPLVGWIIVIVLLCKPSEPGDNIYGPEPK